MSDKLFVGSKLNTLSSTKNIDSVTGIRVLVSDDLNYFSGNESGEVFELECPWGTQQIADNLLTQYKGYKYQPYEADGASLDPAVEIGDAVVVGRIYGGLFKEELKFGAIPKSTFSAPQSKQINHEFPYTSKRERKINRSVKEVKTEITVQAGKIETEIKEREKLDGKVSENSTKITQNTNSISAEVKAREELSTSVDGIEKTVTEHSTSIKANTDGLATEVSERKTLAGKVTENKTAIEQQADSIAAKVSAREGDTSKSFSWIMESTGMEWYNKASLIFKLSESGGEFTGKVTAKSGEIGGWTIESDYLSLNKGVWYPCPEGGVYLGKEGINFGEHFYVRANTGEMVADKVKVTGGKIGDWDISTGLRTGNGSWESCADGEVYFGPEGINLANNFYVDSSGNVTGFNGRFEGTVFASQIAYGGGTSGYMSGGAIEEKTVSGGISGQLKLDSITGGTEDSPGNLALATISTANVNAGFGDNLALVYTNEDNISANTTSISGINNMLNGTTTGVNMTIAGNFKANHITADTSFTANKDVTILKHSCEWKKVSGVWCLTHT